jgi:hypothetical protein
MKGALSFNQFRVIRLFFCLAETEIDQFSNNWMPTLANLPVESSARIGKCTRRQWLPRQPRPSGNAEVNKFENIQPAGQRTKAKPLPFCFLSTMTAENKCKILWLCARKERRSVYVHLHLEQNRVVGYQSTVWGDPDDGIELF